MPPMAVECDRIVIFAPNWVGDAVMFTPALRAIRARFPRARIALLARPAPAAVLTPNPWTDEILVDRGGWWANVRALRERRFDLAILAPNSFRSALLAFLGRAGRRIGYVRDGRGLLLTDRLPPPRAPDGSLAIVPALTYYLNLATALGADASDRRMELAVDDDDAAWAEGVLAEAGTDGKRPAVVLNPGASFGPAKQYPPDRFAAVADALIDRHDAAILINAAPDEQHVADAVAGAMTRPTALNLARMDNSLGRLKAVVKRAALLITNDTGPRHVAAALGTPVVTIFGPTDPGRTTIDYDRERIVRAVVPCQFCQKPRCPLPSGPEHHQCLLNIAPADVIAAADELLALDVSP